MSRRKTIEVARVRELVNNLLANMCDPANHLADLPPEKAYRRGAASVLERILHDTDNYAGFGYLGDYNVDESRRCYYQKP